MRMRMRAGASFTNKGKKSLEFTYDPPSIVLGIDEDADPKNLKENKYVGASGFRETSEITLIKETSPVWTRVEPINQRLLELGLAIVRLEKRLRGSSMVAEDHRHPRRQQSAFTGYF